MEETKVYEERIVSFGDQLVDLEFNPTGDPTITRVKTICSELAEILKQAYTDNEKSPVKSLLFDHAVGEILNAQMCVVKVITMK
jgi:phage terminase large subunit-like protein